MTAFERNGFAARAGSLRLVGSFARTDEFRPSIPDADVERGIAEIERDRAASMIADLIERVPVSRWAFGRMTPDGELVASPASPSSSDEPRLRGELARQRAIGTIGPRIAPMQTGLAPFVFGVTLIFGDASSDRAILTLERDATLGAFTPREDHLLALSLDAVSEELAAPRAGVRTSPDEAIVESHDMAAFASDGAAFFVLATDLRILMAWNAGDASPRSPRPEEAPASDRLPAIVERTVRALTARWIPGGRNEPGIAHPVPFLTVRTHPLSGRDGTFVAVHVDRVEPPGSLVRAAARFRISPREVQVLALLLNGDRLLQIGEHLSIATSTVQDHVRSMIEKTGSRNRSELIARILGWCSPERTHG